MSSAPWIRFFHSDWLAGTRALKPAEAGIYITLICMMYEKGKPLFEDKKWLARLCNTTPATLKTVLDILIAADKILVVDGGLWNCKVDIECKWRLEKTGAASASANIRWDKARQKQKLPDATAVPSQSDCNANQSHIQNQKDTSQAQHPANPPDPVDLDRLARQLREASGQCDDVEPALQSLAAPLGWLGGGHDLVLDILPTIGRISSRMALKPRSWDYYTEAIREASAKRRGLTVRGLAPAEAKTGSTNIFEDFGQDAGNEYQILEGHAVPALEAVHRLSLIGKI